MLLRRLFAKVEGFDSLAAAERSQSDALLEKATAAALDDVRALVAK